MLSVRKSVCRGVCHLQGGESLVDLSEQFEAVVRTEQLSSSSTRPPHPSSQWQE